LYVVQVHFAAPLGLSSSPYKHPSLVSPLQSSLLSCKISLSFSVSFFFFHWRLVAEFWRSWVIT
jgi:hypothetical protein